MPVALLQLIWLQARGVARRGLRGAGTPRRAVLLILGVFVLLLWLGPTVFGAMKLSRSDPGRVRAMAPLALLAICLLTVITSVGDKAISFTPGEVDLLFPAPFTRRQLLAYKLTKSTLAATLTALVLSLALLRHAQWWPACYVGIFLTLLFVQFFSINAVLAAQTLDARVYRTARRVAIAIGLGVGLVLRAVRRGAGGSRVRDRPAARVGGGAGRAHAAVGVRRGDHRAVGPAARRARGCSALLIDGGLLACACCSTPSTWRRRWRPRSAGRRTSAHPRRVAPLPRRGPRRPMEAADPPVGRRRRADRLAAGDARGAKLRRAGPAAGHRRRRRHARLRRRRRSQRIGGALVGVLAWLTFLVSGMVKFDFRGDVDHMETLKALPLRPAAIAAGQLVVPAAMLTVVHVILLLLAAAMLAPFALDSLCAAALALPFNALLFAVENLTFLLYPTRPAAVSVGDFQVLGRQVVVLAVKIVMLVLCCVVPFTLGVLVYVLTGTSLPAATAVAGFLLGGEVVGLIPLLAWAFRRFDPSADTPA